MKRELGYYKYWGKASKEDGSYHLLPYHCLDVAAVGYQFLNQHPFLLHKLSKIMQLPESTVKSWLIFLLGVHDIGKFAESFQQLRTDLRIQLGHGEVQKINYDMRHDDLGYLLWFCRQQGLSKYYQSNGFPQNPASPELVNAIKKLLPVWLAPVIGHHGFPPEVKKRVKEYYQPCDQNSAKEFIEDWFLLIQPDFSEVVQLCSTKQWLQGQVEVSWLIAGFAVLCDWLGSDKDEFEFEKDHYSLDDYWNNFALPRAKSAIEKINILPANIQRNSSINEIFKYIKTPTPLQTICSEMPISDEQQLLILEDVTGAGKTEAALMLAYRLMEKNLAQGLFIGLPTMATANAMLERMAKVYRNFYKEGEQPNVILSHSARHLSKIFQTIFMEQGDPNKETYTGKDETISIQCSRWLADHRKKSLLADIGIGTIDQVLLGVLPVRHQSLRLFGLANKVLILDEVHAYDAYTGSLLNTLLEFHAAMGGCVILLSATLSKSQRQAFVDAFNKGLGCKSSEMENIAYPLLTHIGATVNEELPVQTRKTVQRSVQVKFVHNQEDAIKQLQQAVEQGQCACWIRNTVPDAREAFDLLAAAGGLEKDKLHLFHSRYALGNRLDIEEECLKLFGKESTPDERKGQVLVATQVIEQSLDLDFDVMVSDLAPVDLLIQRAGRLKRHVRDKKGKVLSDENNDKRGPAEFIVYAPKNTGQPDADWYKEVFPKANYVYPDTGLLWLTSQILQKKKGWKMPDDARELIEYVYSNTGNELPENLTDSHIAAEGNELSQRGMAGFNALKHELGYIRDYRVETPWDDEARFPTRLGEDTHAVYLARWENNQLSPWVNEGRFYWDMSSTNVNKGLLTGLAPLQNTELKQAVEKMRQDVLVFDEFSVIVPLQLVDGEWLAEGLNEKGYKMKISYSNSQGLIIGRQE
jgi:CRISPR-associated endonuclease/helicase Cas3